MKFIPSTHSYGGDPLRNPILDKECGMLDFSCKNMQKRAQHQLDITSGIADPSAPPKDTGIPFRWWVVPPILLIAFYGLIKLR